MSKTGEGSDILTGSVIGAIFGALGTAILFLVFNSKLPPFNPNAKLFEPTFNLSTVLQLALTSYLTIVVATRLDLRKSQISAEMTAQRDLVSNNKSEGQKKCESIREGIRKFHLSALTLLDNEKNGVADPKRAAKIKALFSSEGDTASMLERLSQDCESLMFDYSKGPKPMAIIHTELINEVSAFSELYKTYISGISLKPGIRTSKECEGIIQDAKTRIEGINLKMKKIRSLLQ